MNEAKAILAIVAGSVAIVFSLLVKQFYAARGVLGVTLSKRKVPRWQGRLLWLLVGISLLSVGVRFLLFGQ